MIWFGMPHDRLLQQIHNPLLNPLSRDVHGTFGMFASVSASVPFSLPLPAQEPHSGSSSTERHPPHPPPTLPPPPPPRPPNPKKKQNVGAVIPPFANTWI